MSLADRVILVRKQAGLTQAELANRIGLSQTAVHKLEQGRSASSRRTVAIAMACNVDPIWLQTGQGDMIKGLRTIPRASDMDSPLLPALSSRIPLISWELAATWLEQEGAPLGHSEVESWVQATRRVSAQTFAVRVSGDSMRPEFSEDDIIIVDPNVTPDQKRFVLARTESGHVTLKQYMVDGGQRFLKPLNPRYPLLAMTPEIRIIGSVVTKIKDYC